MDDMADVLHVDAHAECLGADQSGGLPDFIALLGQFPFRCWDLAVVAADPQLFPGGQIGVSGVHLAAVREVCKDLFPFGNIVPDPIQCQFHFSRFHPGGQGIGVVKGNVKGNVLPADVSQMDNGLFQLQLPDGIIYHIVFAGVNGGSR